MPANALQADFSREGACVILHLSGALGYDNVPELQARLSYGLSTHHPPNLIVHVQSVRSVDSYGLTVLTAAARHAGHLRGRMLVAGAGDLLQATFTRRNLNEVLAVRSTLADAIGELHGG
ncbi:STAS domain-containing protein [Nonomuraea sp. NPDC059007]|uniref:STAS domain-containing protein n=1 Tax=Nonomuraea sp. NPDC059007 TaxID=3346692 RepID=UPI0036BE10DC